MKITIGGDLVPTISNIKEFEEGNIEKLVDEKLLKIIKKADFRIFNLETPLTDKKDPISKSGPHLIASTASIAGVKKLGVNLVGISNNHILDQGANGLKSTMQVLNESEISFFGAGENLSSAIKPYIIKDGNTNIGVYVCCENEFSVATEKTAGANPFDPLESFDHITSLKKDCDKIIVLYHGGREHYRYPSPNLQKVCRKFVEKGANIVICQHSHCVGCKEKYLEGTIVYGQGNFLFDMRDNEYWNTGLLLEIDTEKEFEINYYPLAKKTNSVVLAEGKDILEGFNNRSDDILKEDFVQEEYKKYATEQVKNYYRIFMGKLASNFVFRAINKLFGKRLASIFYSNKNKLSIANNIRCEAHRELLINGLMNNSKDNIHK